MYIYFAIHLDISHVLIHSIFFRKIIVNHVPRKDKITHNLKWREYYIRHGHF